MPDATPDTNTPSHTATSASKEDRLQAAVQAVQSGVIKSMCRTASAHDIVYSTLHGRLNGCKSNKTAHIKQQHLTEVQSAVVADWFFELVGKLPSDWWIQQFLLKHCDKIKAAKARGLDPKRAQAFNPMMVAGHFKLLQKVLTAYNIKAHNCYNVDKKGLQLGGGCKNLPTQFIFVKGSRDWYAMRSDSLVLVTLVEAVGADGSAVPPVFILPKGSVGTWWEIPGVGS